MSSLAHHKLVCGPSRASGPIDAAVPASPRVMWRRGPSRGYSTRLASHSFLSPRQRLACGSPYPQLQDQACGGNSAARMLLPSRNSTMETGRSERNRERPAPARNRRGPGHRQHPAEVIADGRTAR